VSNILPITTATLYLEPDGTYSATATGVAGETTVTVNVTDGVCVTDLDPNSNETTSDLQGLAQDIYHILLEAPGSNLDDPTRGVGCEGYLSGSGAQLAALPAIIDSQLRKDTRIDSSTSGLTQNPDGSYLLSILVVADGSILPLGFAYTSAGGLVPL
jgi:hypothetical protein